MNVIELLNILFDDSNKEELSEKKQFLLLINQLEKEDVMDYLIKRISLKKDNGTITVDEYKELLEKVSRIDSSNYKTPEQVEERLLWLKKLKLDDLKINIKKSHTEVLETFDSLNLLLNKNNIDYYHTGGILTYLLTNQELVRYHHDLDIFVNEENIENLKQIVGDTNFSYYMYLGERSETTRRLTIKLKDNNTNIVVSVFPFEKLSDGAVIVNDYYFDQNNNLFAVQDYNTPECVKLSLIDDYSFHNGIPFKSISIEALYNCKKGKSFKHQLDCEVLKPFVNFEKEAKIDKEIKPLSEPFEVKDKKIKKMMLNLPKINSNELL